jgi:MFS family permease
MCAVVELYRKHTKFLSFGFLTLFFSGIGQTYLLSFFNPMIQQNYELSNEQQSFIYSAATFCASLCLPFVGRMIDLYPISALSFAVGIGLSLSLVGLTITKSVVALFIGYFFVRMLGQSTISLLATTNISKLFGKLRGKALAFCALGRSCAEGVFPPIVTILLIQFGWQWTLISLAFFVILIYIPIGQLLLKNVQLNEPFYEEKESLSHYNHDLELKDISKDWRIYGIGLTNALLPFVMTGIFFQQAQLTALKGWTTQLWGFGFMAYSAFHILSSLASGYLIDRFSARHILAASLLPLLSAFILFQFNFGQWSCFAFLGLIGMSLGGSATIRNAFYAEVYGPKNLGAIKGVDASVMVIATSLAPVFYAYLLKWLSFSHFMYVQISLITLGIISFAALSAFYRPK